MVPKSRFSLSASIKSSWERLLKSALRQILASGAIALSQFGLVSAEEPGRFPAAQAHHSSSSISRPSGAGPSLTSRHSQATQPGSIQPVSQLIPSESPPTEPLTGSHDLTCRPLSPAWTDPVSEVPNFLGDFFSRSLTGTSGPVTQTLTYTGVGSEGGGFNDLVGPVVVTGPGGPFNLPSDISIQNFDFGTGEFDLDENPELTPQVQALFPGATFLNGGGQFLDISDAEFFYRYLFTSGLINSIALPNPAGGGLVGRIKWVENNSALPQDRFYFYSNHVGNFHLPGSTLDINRYTFGAERVWLDGRVSTEIRLPFAGTLGSEQVAGQALDDQVMLGNLGLLTKLVMYRTNNFILTGGLGLSLPTADDSRMLVNNAPVLEIQNHTTLIQPFLSTAWAPNDRFYSKTFLQFDIDPFGNPVNGLRPNGEFSRIGTLNDQGYMYLSGDAGYWLYQNPSGFVNGIALQGECHYNLALGNPDQVQAGAVSVTDSTRTTDWVNGTAGLIIRMPRHTDFSFGVSFPLAGPRLYDWNAIAQLNIRFGPN